MGLNLLRKKVDNKEKKLWVKEVKNVCFVLMTCEFLTYSFTISFSSNFPFILYFSEQTINIIPILQMWKNALTHKSMK